MPHSEIYGKAVGEEYFRNLLRKYSLDSIVELFSYIAEISHPLENPSLLVKYFKENNPLLYDRIEAAIDKLSQDSWMNIRICGPQAAFNLIKRALEINYNGNNLPDIPPKIVCNLLVAIQDFLDDDPGRMSEDVRDKTLPMGTMANYKFHHRIASDTILKKFESLWESKGFKDKKLPELYQEKLGFSIKKIAFLSADILGYAQNKRSFKAEEINSEENFAEVAKILEHLSFNHQMYLNYIKKTPNSFKAWNFDYFQRFPLYKRSDGSYCLLDITLLIERTLGWSLVYDLEEHLTASKMNEIRALTETTIENHVRENVKSSFVKSDKDVYLDEDELFKNFGKNTHKYADIAFRSGPGWIVTEISAFRPSRGSLTSESVEKYDALFDQIMNEVDQAISTCQQIILQSSESEKLGLPKDSPLLALVVSTEGFISNPFALKTLRDRIEEKYQNLHERIIGVEVINLEELNLLLHLKCRFGLMELFLFQEKANSTFKNYSMANFLHSSFPMQIDMINGENAKDAS